MVKKNVLGSLFLLFSASLMAQELSLKELFPNLKDQAVVVNMVARIIESGQQEVWNSTNSKVTIPGRPVGLRLVGANVIIAVQFTPYFGENEKHVLVAQSQIWLDIPNEGIQYFTTMQTIPLSLGEEVFYFPLGQGNAEASIEIKLALKPYQDAANAEPMAGVDSRQ